MYSGLPDFSPEHQLRQGLFPSIPERHFVEIGDPFLAGLDGGRISASVAALNAQAEQTFERLPSALFRESLRLGSSVVQNVNPNGARYKPRTRSDTKKNTGFIF